VGEGTIYFTREEDLLVGTVNRLHGGGKGGGRYGTSPRGGRGKTSRKKKRGAVTSEIVSA